MNPRCLLLSLLMLNSAVLAAAQAPAPAAEEAYVPEPVASRPATPVPPTPAAEPVAADAGKQASAPGAKPVVGAPPSLSPRFQQVRDRMDALLRHRSETPPEPDPRKNPFRPAGASPVVATRGPAPANKAPVVNANASPSDLALLQQAAAVLKVSGTIQLGGVSHLIINQEAYKEGDVLNARLKGQPIHLRVKNISRYSYTLALNDAELSVKY